MLAMTPSAGPGQRCCLPVAWGKVQMGTEKEPSNSRSAQ